MARRKIKEKSWSKKMGLDGFGSLKLLIKRHNPKQIHIHTVVRYTWRMKIWCREGFFDWQNFSPTQGQLHLLNKQPLAWPGNNNFTILISIYSDILDISTSVTWNEIKLLPSCFACGNARSKLVFFLSLPRQGFRSLIFFQCHDTDDTCGYLQKKLECKRLSVSKW